jgi:predicted DNA-binding protein (UPF0251 family)
MVRADSLKYHNIGLKAIDYSKPTTAATNKIPDMTGNEAIRLLDYADVRIDEIALKMRVQLQLKADIDNTLALLSYKLSDVLKQRYISHKNKSDIAGSISYSRSSINRLYKLAITKFAETYVDSAETG